MRYCINGVMCDTYAHLDQRRVGNTVRVSASDVASHTIVAFLYCDNIEFPVASDAGLVASCWIRHNTGKDSAGCCIGERGEIIVPLPESLCTEGQNLMCEININGTSSGEPFRYKAFEFCVAVVAQSRKGG